LRHGVCILVMSSINWYTDLPNGALLLSSYFFPITVTAAILTTVLTITTYFGFVQSAYFPVDHSSLDWLPKGITKNLSDC